MTPMDLQVPAPPPDEAAPFPSRNEAVAVWAITFLVTMVVAQIIGALFTRYLPDRKEFFLVEAVVIVPALVFAWRRGYDFRTVFRLHPVAPAVIGYSLLVGAGMVIIVNELDSLLRMVLPLPEALQDMDLQMAGAAAAGSPYEWALLLFAVAGLGGLLEEMLFRGMILGALEQSMDTTRAVMVTALMFATMHLWPWMLVQILVIGVVVGVLAWKSNSIWPAVAVHALNNTLAVVSLNASGQTESWLSGSGHVPLLLLLAGVAAAVIGMSRFYAACDAAADAAGRGGAAA